MRWCERGGSEDVVCVFWWRFAWKTLRSAADMHVEVIRWCPGRDGRVPPIEMWVSQRFMDGGFWDSDWLLVISAAPPPGLTYFNITPCSGGGDGQRHDRTISSQYLCHNTVLLQNDDMLSVAIYIAVFFSPSAIYWAEKSVKCIIFRQKKLTFIFATLFKNLCEKLNTWFLKTNQNHWATYQDNINSFLCPTPASKDWQGSSAFWVYFRRGRKLTNKHVSNI